MVLEGQSLPACTINSGANNLFWFESPGQKLCWWEKVCKIVNLMGHCLKIDNLIGNTEYGCSLTPAVVVIVVVVVAVMFCCYCCCCCDCCCFCEKHFDDFCDFWSWC